MRRRGNNWMIQSKNLPRIRCQISIIIEWTESIVRFCIQQSSALLSLICLQKSNMTLISNVRIWRFLIMYKPIFSSNTTSVRHLNIVNFMGDWWMGVNFCVCSCASDMLHFFSFLKIFFYFHFIFYSSHISLSEYTDNQQVRGIYYPIFMKFHQLSQKACLCDFIDALFPVCNNNNP